MQSASLRSERSSSCPFRLLQKQGRRSRAMGMSARIETPSNWGWRQMSGRGNPWLCSYHTLIPGQKTEVVFPQSSSSLRETRYIYPEGNTGKYHLFLFVSLSPPPPSPCSLPWLHWGRGGGWARWTTAAPSPPATKSDEMNHLQKEDNKSLVQQSGLRE